MDTLQLAKITIVVVAGLMSICVFLTALWFFCTRTFSRRKGKSSKNYQNYTELKQVKHIFKYFLTPYLRLSAKSMPSLASSKSSQSCGSLFVGNSTMSVPWKRALNRYIPTSTT